MKSQILVTNNLNQINSNTLKSVILEEDQIANSIATQYDLIRIQHEKVNYLKPIDVLTKDFIIENRIIPFSVDNNKISVAISDPHALEKINTVEMITNKNAEAFVITTSESKFLLDILLSQNESINFTGLNLNESLLGVENSEVINL